MISNVTFWFGIICSLCSLPWSQILNFSGSPDLDITVPSRSLVGKKSMSLWRSDHTDFCPFFESIWFVNLNRVGSSLLNRITWPVSRSVLQTVSGVPCHQSFVILDDFLWNSQPKWVILNNIITDYIFSLYVLYVLVQCANFYDEIVRCSLTSDVTPFSSWMPII